MTEGTDGNARPPQEKAATAVRKRRWLYPRFALTAPAPARVHGARNPFRGKLQPLTASRWCSCTAGPAAATNPQMRRFFNPRRYRIVLYTARLRQGTPHASLEDNTTWILCRPRKLRSHLDIDAAGVRGSWGSTLALAYAQKHPERSPNWFARYLPAALELEWFYQSSEGAASLFPDLWEQYIAPIPEKRTVRPDARVLPALTTPSPGSATPPRARGRSGGRHHHLRTAPGYVAKFGDADMPPLRAHRVPHFVNGLPGIRRPFAARRAEDPPHSRRHRAGAIRRGRPMQSPGADRAWPEAQLVIVPDAGHSAFEPESRRPCARPPTVSRARRCPPAPKAAARC